MRAVRAVRAAASCGELRRAVASRPCAARPAGVPEIVLECSVVACSPLWALAWALCRCGGWSLKIIGAWFSFKILSSIALRGAVWRDTHYRAAPAPPARSLRGAPHTLAQSTASAASAASCGELRRAAASCGELRRAVASCGELRRGSCGELRRAVASCGELWRAVASPTTVRCVKRLLAAALLFSKSNLCYL